MSQQGFCRCLDEQCVNTQFEARLIKSDYYDGMVNRLEQLACLGCGRQWVRYTTDHERGAAWGKWFRCLAEDAGANLSAEEAYHVMESAVWHFYGGAYYRTTGERALGPIRVGGVETWLQAA